MQMLMGLFTGGTSAASTAAATGAAASTATSGFSLSTLLQGGSTVLSAVSSIAAGNQQAQAYELEASDAEQQKSLETLQGINRRASIKQAMMDAVGQQDVAYAASGTDLSFGTAAQARKDAFREADTALGVDAGNEMTTLARLEERRKNYMQMAGNARMMGLFDGFLTGVKGVTSIMDRV
jgi:hypothetical protein